MDLYRYRMPFEPVLLEGMTANIFGSELPPEGKPIQCVSVDALPEYQADFGALTAATWDTDQEDSNLELADMELAQMRMRVQDDMRVRFKNPSSVMKWRTRSASFWMPQFPIDPEDVFLKEYLWAASEFFIWEDHTPRFDLYSEVATSEARILFSGWKFKVITMKSGRGKIDLWVNGWPPATSR